MITLAHIIHPVIVEQSSDLVIAQPITFETMRTAREFAKEKIDISLYAVQYHDEERFPLPECFIRTPDLNRSIGDIKSFKKWKKLALIKDILDTLTNMCHAEYVIYTNVDIALQPYFYLTAAKIIEQGYDAFIINRRTIPKTYTGVEEIPRMYSELGEKHPGWDCFVFNRSLYPSFQLGTACIGTDWIGRTMIANLACLARKFKIFKDLHATFHIGDDRPWEASQLDDYAGHNKNECTKILVEFEKKYGPFDRERYPGRLFRHLGKDKKNEIR